MDLLQKVERAKLRQRNISLDKKNRHKKRNLKCPENGKRWIGNGGISFCGYCRPTLARRLMKKEQFNNYMSNVNRSGNYELCFEILK
jgi:hypothetical protein